MATTMATAAIATTKKRKVDQEELDSFSAQPDSLDPAQQPVPPVADGLTEDAGAAAAEEDDDEDVAKLLEPLHRDLLIDLLRSAAASDPRTLAEIRSAADRDPAHRKIFVHGLGWETNSEGLRSAFAAYGEIEDCNVVVDRATGKSRGYGFLLFRHRRSVVAALRESQKRIDGRMTSSQLASAGPPTQAPAPPQQQQPQTQNYGGGGGGPHHDNLARKIYVGNVSADISGDRLLEFFSRFGEVEEGPVGFDRNTGKPRGFALFVYKTVEGANKALEEPNKVFEGHQLYCQKAQDSSHKRGGGGSATASASTTGHRGGSPPPGFGPLQQQQQQQTYMDMGLQNARLLMGALQPNPAALAMLGVPPAVIAAAMGAAAPPAMAQGPSPTGPLTGPPVVQGYGMGVPGYQNAGYQNAGYQNAGYQNTGYENVGYPNAGYQAPPQQPPQPQQQQPPPIAGAPNVYQGAPMGQPGPPRPMGGYMPH
ncbi:hypothetical protein QJS10_CPA09g00480 [Acorus calamus]|uniref:RRM domain-containing protein n=1 Tax=Acorus calamus TaxID=4465 RepID=A0AAV9E7J8_ACOCL|nr:hypothetical protein QJS10_CPA09g00480 [Acorus calamus]